MPVQEDLLIKLVVVRGQLEVYWHTEHFFGPPSHTYVHCQQSTVKGLDAYHYSSL